MLKKLPEFIQNIVERLFNYSGLDLKYFKQQYDPEVKRKEESRFKGFNLFNKKELEKSTKHINDEMDEYVCEAYLDEDEFYRLMQTGKSCPYYRSGDDYELVRHQN